jgi:2-keto-3-deoxy-L-rhamnonate aldolase RhmA
LLLRSARVRHDCSRAQAASRSPAFSLTPLLAFSLSRFLPSLSRRLSASPAATGYDFILIDQQHSAIDPEKIRCLLQAVHAGGSKAMVRVGGCYDRVGIQQAFDCGADAIMVPCAQTAEDVKHAVSCAKYPVNGPGSQGGTRSVYLNLRPQLPGGFPALFEYASTRGNAETIMCFQIETAGALKNIKEICAVPGIDIAFIGD